MDGPLIVATLAALALGALIGWLIAGRAGGALKAERDLHESHFKRAIADLEGAVIARDAAQVELAALQADARNHERQMKQLLEAKEALSAQFSEVGAKLLGEAQKAFLDRADQRFDQASEKSGERLAKLLAPVNERLKAYEDQVGKVEKDRTEAYGTLTGLIDQMRAGQERVQTEAARLVNSLRNAPKARGRWGEQQLKNVLESCGLSEHCDFVTEVSVETEDGRLRPDAIIRIPGGKSLVIDAKVSLNAYQDAFAADDDDGRRLALAAHCASMKGHVTTLGAKSYQSQFADAPDYVIMFVPGEHFLSAALEHEPGLWDFAFDRKVLLATPTNLVAIARTVSSVWQQDGLAREAREIGRLGSDLYDSLAKTQEDLAKTGIHLGRAFHSFNDFARTYDGNVLSRARRLAEKHVKIGKRRIADEVPLIEIAPRFTESSSDAYGETNGTEADQSAKGPAE